jgi:hypothetical protein
MASRLVEEQLQGILELHRRDVAGLRSLRRANKRVSRHQDLDLIVRSPSKVLHRRASRVTETKREPPKQGAFQAALGQNVHMRTTNCLRVQTILAGEACAATARRAGRRGSGSAAAGRGVPPPSRGPPWSCGRRGPGQAWRIDHIYRGRSSIRDRHDRARCLLGHSTGGSGGTASAPHRTVWCAYPTG